MRRVAFLSGDNLLEKAKQLATDVEPWAERIDCHVYDYVRAGGRADALKLPISRPMIGNVGSFARTHIVRIVPGYEVGEGQIARDV